MGGFVDGPSVVRTVGGDGCDGRFDLLEQGGPLRTIMRPASSQIRRYDLTCVRIDSEVQLAPGPVLRRLLHMTDVNPEPGAVDE